MPCSACNKSLIERNDLSEREQRVLQGCDYTKDMMIAWKDKLMYVKDNNLYDQAGINPKQYNSFLGTVLSGINFEYNICFLADKLDLIKPYIMRIIAL